jgi:hypothetical protein
MASHPVNEEDQQREEDLLPKLGDPEDVLEGL